MHKIIFQPTICQISKDWSGLSYCFSRLHHQDKLRSSAKVNTVFIAKNLYQWHILR